MIIKTPFYTAIIIGMTCISLTAQTKSQLDNEISKVEAGLIPAVRFQGEPTWTLESRMKHYNVPGVSVAVIRNSKVIWSKTYGFADVESKTPVNSKTLFQAASMSKPVTAYVALTEVEAGKINPDADVNSYLKSWKVPENEFTKEKKVTFKNIVSHTAGFTVSGFPGYEAGKPVPSLIQVLNGQSPSNTTAIFVDKVPGTPFRYAGGGYCVLQQMLIDLEGKDFTTIMKEKVLLPLDMKNSTFSQPLFDIQSQFSATAYNQDGVKVSGKSHTYPEQAAAGLWTTAEDYAKFVIDIQNTLSGKSSTIISQKMAEQFTTSFIDPFMGLGVFLEDRRGHMYFNHGGWNEGFSSRFIASKTSGDGIVVLTNTNKPDFVEELVRSVAEVYHWPLFNGPVQKIVPLNQNDFKNAGRYRNGKYGFSRVYNENGKLMSVYNVETPVEMIKVGENKYAFRDWDLTVKFVKNADTGKTDRVQIYSNGKIKSTEAQMSTDDKTPLEMVLEGNFDKGLEAYKKAKTEDADDDLLSEGYLNGAGYKMLGNKEFTKAIDIFRVNAALYPKSENVYDSLGEAYLKAGQKVKAKESYQKILEINPKNENAVTVLKTL
ncbi:serine hydrolase [Chryseobacterium carnipullorum]|uniref:Beta-lactamase n=1 Tax=Chryseobacterium carnipullorum TaxID=1124835 RepID=A0A376E2Q1_CHRCU|nr:serine hydrolase domain-containing protein [Chryseobacterium carnipullorum]AZA50636.1 serine hydrolase [Chryseobacterium carnipullorum]AZA65502.1 serine hydrolase [Chryseobacterium carnipullorum]STD01026.1 Beta-lactamase [Chryseobacterium carnipullorum]